jgi:hypothetical protein
MFVLIEEVLKPFPFSYYKQQSSASINKEDFMKILKNIPLIALVITYSFLMTACVSVYRPNPVNTPLLEKSGDVKASLVIQDGLHLQSAAAINNNIAVMFNAGYDLTSFKNAGISEDEDDKEHTIIEGGIGFFDKFSDNWLWEIYTGYGVGTFQVRRDDHGFWEPDPMDAEGNIGRFFIQPAVAYSTKNFAVSMSLRTCYVTILDYKTNSSTRLSKYGYFYEPAITMKFGGEKFKVVTQMGYSRPRRHAILTGWEPEPFFGGIGFEVNIGSLIKNN